MNLKDGIKILFIRLNICVLIPVFLLNACESKEKQAQDKVSEKLFIEEMVNDQLKLESKAISLLSTKYGIRYETIRAVLAEYEIKSWKNLMDNPETEDKSDTAKLINELSYKFNIPHNVLAGIIIDWESIQNTKD